MGRGRVCFFLYYVAGGPSRARRHPGIRAVRKGITMTLYFVVGLSAVVGLGVAAQWAASRLRIPSILLLLTFGIAAGPLTGLLHPDDLFGPLLLPVVSLSVAVVLFEGGLSLKLRELRQIGGDLLRLTTVGVLVAWLLTAAAARYVLGFDWPLAALLGAILVVTGPTVIGPLLRHLRLGGRVGAVLKWEGIVIDPLGAMLAVLVFVVARAEGRHGITLEVFANLGRTALVGGGLGAGGGLPHRAAVALLGRGPVARGRHIGDGVHRLRPVRLPPGGVRFAGRDRHGSRPGQPAARRRAPFGGV